MKKRIFLLGFLLLTACNVPAATPVTALFPTAAISPTPLPTIITPQLAATAASSPSPEFTATPFPRFFTDEFDTLQAGWAILQAGSEAVPNVKAENSHLILQMDSPYTWAYAL